MSLASIRSTVALVQKELADLRAKDAAEAKKEADLIGKVNKATSDARATKSASTMTSKLNEVTRYSNELASVQKKRADLSKSIASKTTDLNRHLGAQAKEEERERKKLADEDRKLQDRRNKQLKDLDRQIAASAAAFRSLPTSLATADDGDQDDQQYDVFISHASEDKESFANGLAEKLTAAGVAVWYDDMVLGWGDSLRRSIDKGLARSRFGVVILSEHFFKKEWPQRELDGLVQLEIAGQSRILPIWHKISKDEVARASPTLADKVALNTSLMSTDDIVAELKKLAGK